MTRSHVLTIPSVSPVTITGHPRTGSPPLRRCTTRSPPGPVVLARERRRRAAADEPTDVPDRLPSFDETVVFHIVLRACPGRPLAPGTRVDRAGRHPQADRTRGRRQARHQPRRGEELPPRCPHAAARGPRPGPAAHRRLTEGRAARSVRPGISTPAAAERLRTGEVRCRPNLFPPLAVDGMNGRRASPRARPGRVTMRGGGTWLVDLRGPCCWSGCSCSPWSASGPPAERWFTGPEAVAYGLADEVIGGPAGAPESGTPA